MSLTVILILVAIGLIALKIWLEFVYHVELLPAETYSKRAVFISGCDMGFGEASALALDKLGFKVFAGCRTKEGVEQLKTKGSSKLTAFVMDITSAEDIENAVKLISKEAPNGLWATINSAGIGIGGPVEWLPMSDYRRVMEVNFFGHVAVTKALLPLIKKTGGRVVNVSSLAGLVAAHHLSAYSGSKYALEAFSDSLRREMIPFGVDVVLIEPTFTKTNMTVQGFQYIEKLWSEITPELKEQYGQGYYDKAVSGGQRINGLSQSVSKVLAVYVKSVTLKHPKSRYPVGLGTTTLAFLLSITPARIMDFIISKGMNTPVAYKKPTRL